MVETFEIIPGQVRMMWLLVPLVLVALLAGGLVAYSLGASRSARFEVSPDGLRLRGDLYGRLIPPQKLRLGEARAVDLRSANELNPRIRTMGTGVPGYRSGWFKLRSGEKALVYLTDPSSVLYIPTSDGYSVLLSVSDPEAMLTSLRRHASGTR